MSPRKLFFQNFRSSTWTRHMSKATLLKVVTRLHLQYHTTALSVIEWNGSIALIKTLSPCFVDIISNSVRVQQCIGAFVMLPADSPDVILMTTPRQLDSFERVQQSWKPISFCTVRIHHAPLDRTQSFIVEAALHKRAPSKIGFKQFKDRCLNQNTLSVLNDSPSLGHTSIVLSVVWDQIIVEKWNNPFSEAAVVICLFKSGAWAMKENDCKW